MKFKVLALVLFSLIAALPANAICRGQNLYDNSGAAFQAIVEKQVAKIPYSSGHYWQVSKDGKTNTIVGTVHLRDIRISKIPAFLKPKIRQARTVYKEVTSTETNEVIYLLKKAFEKSKSQKKPKKFEWWSRLTSSEQKLLQREARIKGKAFHKIKKGSLNRAISLIQNPKCESGTSAYLDKNIEKYARKAKIPVRGLDDAKMLAAQFLKDDTGAEDTFFVFRENLKRLKLRRHYVETMIQMYKRNEAEKYIIFATAAKKAYVPAKYHRATERTFREDILVDRNRLWIKKLVPELSKGNVVVAFGTAHLPGRNGVLNLLRKKGFKIERLTP